MIVEEFLEITVNDIKKLNYWKNKSEKEIQIGESFKVHWTLLIGTKYRDMKIKLKCDECDNIYHRPIRRYIKKEIDICKKCSKLGDRNPMFGKEMNENTKKALRDFFDEHGNPFTWEYVKEKLKEKKAESVEKAAKKNRGRKISKETREKKSLIALSAYKEGRWKVSKGYSNIKIKKYKGIPYQGTYELNFLKFIEGCNLLDKIERGPRVSYFFEDVEHSYFVDFKLKETDILFEIKSSYFWNKAEKVNIIKKQTCEKIFDYNLIIDNNFSDIEKKLTKFYAS